MIILPFWGRWTPRVAAMFAQDSLVLACDGCEFVFHPSAAPSDVLQASRRLQSAGFKSRMLSPGETPDQVWLYSGPDNPARAPSELRAKVLHRVLDVTFKPKTMNRMPVGPETKDPRTINDYMPPFRNFVPQSDAPAWMNYTPQELRYLTDRADPL